MTKDELVSRREGRLLICLAGGRPDAAVYTAQHFDPDEVIIVYSETNAKSAADLRQALREATPRTVCEQARPTHPYRTTHTTAVLTDLLATAEWSEVALSLTGAPMPMGVAGYQVAQDFDISAFYLDTGNEELYDLASATPARPVHLRLKVEAFLRQHGLAIDEKHDAQAMVGSGHDFEREIWQAASDLRAAPEATSEPFFDDCQSGVKFKIGDAGREIDLFCIYHGVAVIASCKTGLPKNVFVKEHLDILNAVAEKLGARYCTRLFIAEEHRQARPENADRHAKFLQQAHSASTVVITRVPGGFHVHRLPGQSATPAYEPIEAILRRDARTPTYPRQ